MIKISNSEFKIISNQQFVNQLKIDIVQLRRKYIYKLVGGFYSCGGGVITMEFPNGLVKKIKTKNLARRLDEIFRQLMGVKEKEAWIANLKKTYGIFSLKEIKQIKIKIEEENKKDRALRLSKSHLKEENSPATFILTFPNNKCYLGRARNAKVRIAAILTQLFKKELSWAAKCLEENPNLTAKSIQIDLYPFEDYNDLKTQISNYYNSTF